VGFQIVEALAYLHNVEQIVHLNVCPQSIVVTKRGMWKLAGFAYAVSHSSEQQTVRHNYIVYKLQFFYLYYVITGRRQRLVDTR